MMNEQKVPQLRFSGFEDEWEYKIFQDLFERRMERNNGQFGYDRWISVAKMYFQEPEKVTSNNIDTRTYVMRKSDIAFEGHSNKEFKLGRFVENDIGDGVISELFPIYKHKDEYNLSYWKYAIQNENIMFPKLTKCIEVSYTSSNKLDENFFLNEKILVPIVREQQKIGFFLSQIDTLIQTKTQKLESLKSVKKSLLQKCFPKAGEKVPEMRFESNKEWASINFEDCFSFLSNNSFSRDELNYEKGYIKSLHYGDVLIKFGEILNVSTASLPYITQINAPKQYSKSILKNGDIVIADAAEDNTVGKCTEIQNCTELLAAGLHTIAVRPKIEFAPTFLGFCINSESFHNQLLPLIQGTKVSSISKSAIVDTVIYYPISITEQQKIGQFFSKYDSLISVQQKEIDKLKNIKKSLLQKMFV